MSDEARAIAIKAMEVARDVIDLYLSRLQDEENDAEYGAHLPTGDAPEGTPSPAVAAIIQRAADARAANDATMDAAAADLAAAKLVGQFVRDLIPLAAAIAAG